MNPKVKRQLSCRGQIPSPAVKLGILLLLLTAPLVWRCDKKNPAEPKSDIPAPEGWELVWHDEFDGATIDATQWGHEVNAAGGGNNELQYYTSRAENSFIENGFLVIQALKERYTGTEGTRAYTSARLRTYLKGDWKYGRFDIKAKLPYGQGLWPAIWMLPTASQYGGWLAGGEIDIMELVGHEPNKVYGTIHFANDQRQVVSRGAAYVLPSGNFSDDFHIFTLEWEPAQIRWYVDGIFYQNQNEWYTANAAFPAPFDQYFHLLLNVAVGGTWPGNPDFTTVFPQKLTVDYVRVFKKLD